MIAEAEAISATTRTQGSRGWERCPSIGRCSAAKSAVPVASIDGSTRERRTRDRACDDVDVTRSDRQRRDPFMRVQRQSEYQSGFGSWRSRDPPWTLVVERTSACPTPMVKSRSGLVVSIDLASHRPRTADFVRGYVRSCSRVEELRLLRVKGIRSGHATVGLRRCVRERSSADTACSTNRPPSSASSTTRTGGSAATSRAKKKLIALLDEQKQAIIHRAVTRGLDPSVRLKPSGVEWLGDVPEHWEVATAASSAATSRRRFTRPDACGRAGPIRARSR